MHMADALISPAVGSVMWGAAAGLAVASARRMRHRFDSNLIPLMGVLGAFVFAAQMVNFTIPGTGSSGHLGGGMLLSILLGPCAAFITMTSILVVQALFFADGGLLALGCNIINLGFFPCFVAYPLVYSPLAAGEPGPGRLMAASLFASVMGLEMGALGVVTESTFSGLSALPSNTFLMLMLPVHLAIGAVEGLVTAGVVRFVYKARPELLHLRPQGTSWSLKKVAMTFGAAALVVGGVLCWFASTHPDGLEWSVAEASGKAALESPNHGLHQTLAKVQDKTSIMPDYNFKDEAATASEEKAGKASEEWPHVDAATSTAGVLGGSITLLLAVLLGLLLHRRMGIEVQRQKVRALRPEAKSGQSEKEEARLRP